MNFRGHVPSLSPSPTPMLSLLMRDQCTKSPNDSSIYKPEQAVL